MATSIKLEDRVDGSSNFNNWKSRIIAILEEKSLDHYITSVVEEPTTMPGELHSRAIKENQGESFTIL